MKIWIKISSYYDIVSRKVDEIPPTIICEANHLF